jgi:hypothetical protein
MRPDMANTTDQHESAPQSFVCGVPDVEDDLRILRGTLKALSMISVCQDEIHPEGLHVLARFGPQRSEHRGRVSRLIRFSRRNGLDLFRKASTGHDDRQFNRRGKFLQPATAGFSQYRRRMVRRAELMENAYDHSRTLERRIHRHADRAG